MTTQENIHSDQDEPFDGIRENRENKPPAYFNILFYGLILWGLIFMGYYLLSGWSSQGELLEKMDAHQQQYSQGAQGGK
jgi:cytochrome c oxidase cbb3-type subunit 3